MPIKSSADNALSCSVDTRHTIHAAGDDVGKKTVRLLLRNHGYRFFSIWFCFFNCCCRYKLWHDRLECSISGMPEEILQMSSMKTIFAVSVELLPTDNNYQLENRFSQSIRAAPNLFHSRMRACARQTLAVQQIPLQ